MLSYNELYDNVGDYHNLWIMNYEQECYKVQTQLFSVISFGNRISIDFQHIGDNFKFFTVALGVSN